MAWILETASGKFIDNFASKGEAEKARKNIGIVGCRVRQGKVPVTRLLATQGGALPPHFQSVDAFVDYLADDDRSTYTTAELNKLVVGTHTNRSALVERLRAKNIVGELHKKPVRAAPKPPPVPTGWKKPLAKDDSERTKAKRVARARSAAKVPLEKLTESVVNAPIASLNQTQQGRKRAFAEGLATRHLDILLRMQEYNEAIDEIDRLIGNLEDKSGAISDAITEYNAAVGAASDFITEIRDSAQEYAETKSSEWQDTAAGQAFQEWIETLDALPDLEEIDEDAANIPDQPEVIGDEFRIDESGLDDEVNADVLLEIPDGPVK